MVIDTSVILAVYFNEPRGTWAAERMNEYAGQLRMSTVNLAEALIRIRDRQPMAADDLEQRLRSGAIRFIAPDEKQASIAAAARIKYPLNLGDCFAYALAVAEGCPILTLDADFRQVDIPVIFPETM